MPFEERNSVGLIEFSGGEVPHQVAVFHLRGCELVAIHVEKNERRHHTDPFVAVNEWMVHRQMMQISCRHRGEVFMKILSAKHCARLSDRGFEQSHVADAEVTAVLLDRVAVDFESPSDAEKSRSHL